MSDDTKMIAATILVGLAAIAGLWVAAIGPRRGDSAELRGSVAEQQARLDAARSQVAAYGAARTRFPGLLAELKRLDVAVPGRGAIADLLRELQRRARVNASDLRLAELKSGGAAPPGAAASVTPGAIPGPGGLSALPFTFEYDGEYFDLLRILRAVRGSVKVATSGDLRVGGRLLTIDGLAFKRTDAGASRTKAIVNATAYIAPERAAAAAPAGAPTAGAK